MGRDPSRIFQKGEVHTISCASLRPQHTVHPVHKIQRFEYDVSRTIAVRCFELVAHLAVPRQ